MRIREALNVQRGDIVAFTGGGGKSSTLFRLGRELAEEGWRVVDFWESRAQFDAFMAERVGPAVAATGVSTQPDIAEFPIHEYVAR